MHLTLNFARTHKDIKTRIYVYIINILSIEKDLLSTLKLYPIRSPFMFSFELVCLPRSPKWEHFLVAEIIIKNELCFGRMLIMRTRSIRISMECNTHNFPKGHKISICNLMSVACTNSVVPDNWIWQTNLIQLFLFFLSVCVCYVLSHICMLKHSPR